MVKYNIKIYTRKWLENLTRMDKEDITEFLGSEQFYKILLQFLRIQLTIQS